MLNFDADDFIEEWPYFTTPTNSDSLDTAETPRLLQDVVNPDLENWNPNGEQEINR